MSLLNNHSGASQPSGNAEAPNGKAEGAADNSPRLTYEEWSKLASEAAKAAKAEPEPAPQPTYDEWANEVLQVDQIRASRNPWFGLGGRRRGA